MIMQLDITKTDDLPTLLSKTAGSGMSTGDDAAIAKLDAIVMFSDTKFPQFSSSQHTQVRKVYVESPICLSVNPLALV